MKTAEYNRAVVSIHSMVIGIKTQLTFWGTSQDNEWPEGPGPTGMGLKRYAMLEGMDQALHEYYAQKHPALLIM